MSDDEDLNNSTRVNYSRPSLAQVKAVVALMEKHPEFANKKQRLGTGQSKFKKFWVELANSVNALGGSVKSTKGWMKCWADKKRFIKSKQKQIEEGKINSCLTVLEHKIYSLSAGKAYTPRKKKTVKEEPSNSDDDLDLDSEDMKEDSELSRLASTHAEERQLTLLDKMIVVMDQQASAMTQIAKASLDNSKALERIAEASHVQALAVDRMVGSFESIGSTAHDIRTALLGIDYTLKRCYPNNVTRQNSTLFS